MKALTKNCLLAICLGSALLALACSGASDSLSSAGKGQVQISMTAGSGPTINAVASAKLTTSGTRRTAPSVGAGMGEPSLASLQSANVTFSKIQARAADGTWVDVLISLPATIDMVAIRDGKSVQLPSGFLPPGTYDQLAVTITQVDIVLMDDTKISITPPADGWTSQIATKPFEITDGKPTTVSLRFREDTSFTFLGGTIGFEPDFECEG